MVVLPAINPVTTPDEETVAIPGKLLPQVPGVVASFSVVTDPASQTDNVPVIGAGMGSTLTVVVAMQPVLVIVYVIGATPDETPVITPEAVPVAVAIAVAPLLQVPVPGELFNTIVAPPAQTVFVAPVIAAGKALTVASMFAVHAVVVSV